MDFLTRGGYRFIRLSAALSPQPSSLFHYLPYSSTYYRTSFSCSFSESRTYPFLYLYIYPSIHPSTYLPVYPSVSATPLSNQIIVEHRFLDRHVENCTLLRFSVLFHFDASGAMFFDAWVNYNDFTATSLGITGSSYMEFSFNGIHCDPKMALIQLGFITGLMGHSWETRDPFSRHKHNFLDAAYCEWHFEQARSF